MAAFTMDGSGLFPPSSTVNVYSEVGFTTSGPTSAVVTSAVADGAGSVTFSGLTENTRYVAAQLQSGTWVRRTFQISVVSTGGGSGAPGPAGPTGNTGPTGPPGAAGGTAIPIVLKSASFTVALADAGSRYNVLSAGAIVATIPLNATAAIPVGSIYEIVRRGTGGVSILATGGVTVNSAYGYLTLARQFSAASLVKVATDEWDLHGDLV